MRATGKASATKEPAENGKENCRRDGPEYEGRKGITPLILIAPISSVKQMLLGLRERKMQRRRESQRNRPAAE